MDRRIILVADSDVSRRQHLARALSTMALYTSSADSLDALRQQLYAEKYKVLLVHENVTNGQMARTCRGIRAADRRLVIVAYLARTRSRLETRLFDAGVDDVISSRTTAQAVARRIVVRLRDRCLRDASDDLVYIGDAVVDFKNLEVWSRGAIHTLSTGLSSLLKYFLDNRDRAVSRKEVIEALWADAVIDPDGRNLDMHISKLRRLIEPDPKHPSVIQAVRGVGYVLCSRAGPISLADPRVRNVPAGMVVTNG